MLLLLLLMMVIDENLEAKEEAQGVELHAEIFLDLPSRWRRSR